MIDPGVYTFKITEAHIKVNKKEQKYLMLKLELLEGDSIGAVLSHTVVPWYEENWLHNIRSIFTEFDIQTYMLEYRDEDTLWVVSQLAVGEIVTGVVRQENVRFAKMYDYYGRSASSLDYPPGPYNSVYLTSKAIACQNLSEN